MLAVEALPTRMQIILTVIGQCHGRKDRVDVVEQPGPAPCEM